MVYQVLSIFGKESYISPCLIQESWDLRRRGLRLQHTACALLTRRSSRGSQPVGSEDGEYMTTIFTISCSGTIGIRLQDSAQYSFAYHTQNHSILARPTEPQKLSRRWVPALHTFHKRAEEGFNHVGDSWEPFTFLAGPLRVSDHYQIGYAPRCPAAPFGLQSFVRAGARATGFNGCGADNGMKFPDFRFTICCNNHDLCYGN